MVSQIPDIHIHWIDGDGDLIIYRGQPGAIFGNKGSETPATRLDAAHFWIFDTISLFIF